jgi:hypothetical protein
MTDLVGDTLDRVNFNMGKLVKSVNKLVAFLIRGVDILLDSCSFRLASSVYTRIPGH